MRNCKRPCVARITVSQTLVANAALVARCRAIQHATIYKQIVEEKPIDLGDDSSLEIVQFVLLKQQHSLYSLQISGRRHCSAGA